MAEPFLKAMFYVGIAIAAVGGLGILALSFPADPAVQYTVVNNTERELLTWVMDEPCSKILGHRGDYSRTESVLPNDRVEYGAVTSENECIQVTTTDRRLVTSAEYEDNVTIVISEPLTFLSDPVPAENDLPRGSRASPIEFLITNPARELVVAYVSLALIALGGGIALGARNLQRRRGVKIP